MSHGQTEHTQQSPKPKSGKVIGIIILSIFVLVALFTVSHFVNSKEDEKSGFKEEKPFANARKEHKTDSDEKVQPRGNDWNVAITEDEPESNNISIPPGSVYEIKTSTPVYILFEDADGNIETRELRPGQNVEFPLATPIKIWRQKPGKSTISYSFTQKN